MQFTRAYRGPHITRIGLSAVATMLSVPPRAFSYRTFLKRQPSWILGAVPEEFSLACHALDEWE